MLVRPGYVALAFAATNFVRGVEVARGQTAVRNQSPAGAYIFLGSLALLCTVGNVRMLLRGGLSGPQRLVRHLWRMCFGRLSRTSLSFSDSTGLSHMAAGIDCSGGVGFLPLVFLIFGQFGSA